MAHAAITSRTTLPSHSATEARKSSTGPLKYLLGARQRGDERQSAKRARDLRRENYAKQMLIASHAATKPGGQRIVYESLERWRPTNQNSDLRDFEWYALSCLANPGIETLEMRPPLSISWRSDADVLGVFSLPHSHWLKGQSRLMSGAKKGPTDARRSFWQGQRPVLVAAGPQPGRVYRKWVTLRHAGAFGGRRSRTVGEEKPTTLIVPSEFSQQQVFRAPPRVAAIDWERTYSHRSSAARCKATGCATVARRFPN